jgi:hypothetical protein
MKFFIGLFLTLVLLGNAAAAGPSISLAGQWRFQLDRADAGISEQWFDRALPDKIKLPGSLPAQGIGDNITAERGLKPIVRVIDDWVTARPLGLVIEAKVANGKIIVCGFDLTGELNDPVSREMRQSLLAYMASNNFHPPIPITELQVSSLIADANN